jgi:hypothetical protein
MAARLPPPRLKATITKENPPALFCTDLTHSKLQGWILLRQWGGGLCGYQRRYPAGTEELEVGQI